MAAEKNADIDFSSPEYYLNRELSELEFQRRVLHEAEDERNPLLERVRALTYFSKNTDEFFMKRIGGLKLEIEAGMTDRGIDGRTPREQWSECLGRFRQMQQSAYDVWESKVRPALAEADIRIEPVSRLPARVRESLRRRMEKSILPMLTPLAFDPAHPFPLISNLSVSLGILVPNEEGEEPTFTRIKVPPNHPAYLPAEEGATLFVSLSDLIRSNIDLVLPGRTVDSAALFRVTRSAEVRLEEPQDDLVEMTLDVLEKRRTAQAIRLEVTPDFPQEILSLLMRRLDLTGSELFRHSEPMALRNLSFLTSLDRPELRYPAWSPRPHPRLESDDTSIFDEIRKGDILLHHPYHSFELTTQRFFDEAAEDPDVLAIKVAIYRTANDSKVIGSLLTAGENGKQVAAIIELKARFDERRNVTWVQRLEEKGIHVAYGMMHRKTHTKIAMVVRREGERLRFYSHIGTGNYHAGTAKTYVDLGLLTADELVGRDLMHVFNIFTGPLH
ncbi:polyphosphate kinase 1, partial [Salinispira pacifica]